MTDALEEVSAALIDMLLNFNEDGKNFVDPLFSHLNHVGNSYPCAAFTAALQDASAVHVLTEGIPPSFHADKSYGILVDSGCASGSSGDHSQYLKYYKAFGQNSSIDPTRTRHCQFSLDSEVSKVNAKATFLLGDTRLSFDIYVISADVPILLGLPHMHRLGVFINNFKDRLVNPSTDQFAFTIRQFGYAFPQWNTHIVCHFSNVELRQLHRRFGCPSTIKCHKFLECAEVDCITAETRHALAKIERECRYCQTYTQRPRRFEYTFNEDKYFNYAIYAAI